MRHTGLASKPLEDTGVVATLDIGVSEVAGRYIEKSAARRWRVQTCCPKPSTTTLANWPRVDVPAGSSGSGRCH